MDVRKTGTVVGRTSVRPDADLTRTLLRRDADDGRANSRAKARPTIITGTHINYYFICHRKLWLFSRGVQMEQTSDTVLLGKLIDESSYERKDKGIDIDGTIVVDWIDDKSGVLHEVKKSDSMEESHTWQVLYYLWYLKHKGVHLSKGQIDYPKLKQNVEVTLTPEREEQLRTIMDQIEQVTKRSEAPERLNKRFCKTCSYFDLCWANQ